MTEFTHVERRRPAEAGTRCGQMMFEYYRSPDGHYGLVGELEGRERQPGQEVRCPTCGARYRLLDRLDAMGHPVRRQ